ncbi:MAG: DNRLRE domain-containing protein [Gammaproteobacteria bacterium]
MKNVHPLPGIALVSSLLFSTVASAASIDLHASKDTSIYDNGRVNGTGQGVFVGKAGNDIVQRSLIAFDLGAIPAGSTIDNVTLTMHVNAQGFFGATENITLNALNADWNEAANGSGDADSGGGGGVTAVAGDATWTDSGNGAWTAGGDFNATASASTAVDGLGFHNWSSASLITDIQNWVDNGDNYGWILRGNEINGGSSKRFSSRENTGSGGTRVPLLTIEFTPVPVPAAVWLFGSGLIALAGIARRKLT